MIGRGVAISLMNAGFKPSEWSETLHDMSKEELDELAVAVSKTLDDNE
eukprot:SAG31_NODE_4938_length_2849_cov_2.097091_2_plen_48_part_00